MVLPGVPRKKSPVTPPGIDPGTSQLVAQCLNQYATPGPEQKLTNLFHCLLAIFRVLEETSISNFPINQALSEFHLLISAQTTF